MFFREAVPKTTSSAEPCRAWSDTSTWSYLMHIFTNRWDIKQNIYVYFGESKCCNQSTETSKTDVQLTKVVLRYILQYPLAFVSNFSQWMCCHAWLYRLLGCMDLSELSASADLVTRGARVLVRKSDVLSKVCGSWLSIALKSNTSCAVIP